MSSLFAMPATMAHCGRVDYLTAFRHHAKQELPAWQYGHVHDKAVRTAGGYAPKGRPEIFPDDAQDEADEAVWNRDPVLALAKAALRPPALALRLTKRDAPRSVPVIDAQKNKQVVFCVAMEPDTFDAHDDMVTADDIENACWDFNANARTIGRMHVEKAGAELVESYIAPQDLHFDAGMYGPQVVTKGSWVIGVRVHDPDDWAKVVSGEYGGVSIGGTGRREELNA